jgi:hypothetical protein
MGGWKARWSNGYMLREWVDGWMDEWVDGWMDSWMDDHEQTKNVTFLQCDLLAKP